MDKFVDERLPSREPLDPLTPRYPSLVAVSYKELLDEVCQISNMLISEGVKKGDRVVLYMSMVTQLPAAMLACARIGAVHAVVFGGFSAEALASRIEDAEAKVVLTCSAAMRGNKRIELKKIADEALDVRRREIRRASPADSVPPFNYLLPSRALSPPIPPTHPSYDLLICSWSRSGARRSPAA